MTSSAPTRIVCRASGKLFIAGEYAVVSPGEPAVLVAVDRYLTATLTPTAAGGSIHSPSLTDEPVRLVRADGRLTASGPAHAYTYVLSAITLADRLRAERRLPLTEFDLAFDSALDDPDRGKYGLGSSAAATVATVRALSAHFGLGLSRLEVYRLAMMATVRVSPAASGGDLAAAVFGGWIAYRSPDRAALAAVVDVEPVEHVLRAGPWRGLQIEPLPAPTALRLMVGWTGSPASTDRLVGNVSERVGTEVYTAFVQASRANVETMIDALRSGDDDTVSDAVRYGRVLVRGLGLSAGVDIETARLSALCDDAEALGAAAKSSGAGGGDCGIALVADAHDSAALARTWERDGILPLPVAVAAPEPEEVAHGRA